MINFGYFTRKSKLASNTFMLYCLMFSNYIVYFLTIPYQARVLGPELFGLVSFAMTLTAYIQIYIDFGFMYSGVEKIANAKKNVIRISSLYSAIMGAKVILLVSASMIAIIIYAVVRPAPEHTLLFALFFIGNSLKSFIPDYIYRGLEDMRSITLRTVTIQVLFAVILFTFLKSPEDYMIIPILVVCSSILSLAVIHVHLRSRGIKLSLPKLHEITAALSESKLFFLARASSYLYSTSNILLVGFIYGPASYVTGHYTASDRLMTAVKQLVNPVSDSLYPYMIRKRDYKLLIKILVAISLVAVILVLFFSLYAEQVAVLVFGEAYRGASTYLTLLSISAGAVFIGQLCGYAMLAPIGKVRYVNISSFVGLTVYVLSIFILVVLGELTALSICVILCITEASVLLYRIVSVVRNRAHIFNS
jgi:PST family polysaccharide transporter